MIHESQLRRRYLAEDVPRRLGQLASTLHRLSDFMTMGRPVESVLNVMDEGLRFVKWTHGDLSEQAAGELDRLAADLRGWRGAWPGVSRDSSEVGRIAGEAQIWSEQVLQMSGLLTPEVRTG